MNKEMNFKKIYENACNQHKFYAEVIEEYEDIRRRFNAQVITNAINNYPLKYLIKDAIYVATHESLYVILNDEFDAEGDPMSVTKKMVKMEEDLSSMIAGKTIPNRYEYSPVNVDVRADTPFFLTEEHIERMEDHYGREIPPHDTSHITIGFRRN